MSGEPTPLERLSFDTARLMTEHPPVWRDPNKEVVFAIACPPGTVHRGTLTYSRWAAMSLPNTVDLAAADRVVDGREDAYDYAPALADAVEWHVNFADPHLFVAYGSSLFAQDEMQVAEHPALGALKEALDAGGHVARTEERGQPTPVLVMGVERRCRVATDPNPAAGRPHGLYGNNFAWADEDAIRRATTAIDPPTITNLIAMAAPAGGSGRYDRATIARILVTAYTGFRAAVLESERQRGHPGPVAVHTGFWGCGAFGGDRVLMALLQAIAAAMAGVDRLVFHTFDRAGTRALAQSRKTLAGTGEIETDRLIDRIVDLGFRWGVSDGN